jgi:N-acetylglucosamine-6-sulfatase
VNPTPPRHWWTASIAAIVTCLAIVVTAGFFAVQARPSQAASASTVPADATTPAVAPGVVNPLLAPSPTDPTDPTAVNPLAAEKAVVDGIENVVFILADDLDWAAFRQVPRLNALQAKGTTFLNNTVTDSLCCPSRVSILRSQYVHNHLVVSNDVRSGGGWPTFAARGEEQDCLPIWLHNAGVQTAFFGKYLNAYPDGAASPTYVPPGWDRWVVPITQGAMYRGYNYTLNSNGSLKQYGSQPKDFLGDVLTSNATDFIGNALQPFYLQLNLTNPHRPSPIAARHRASDKSAVIPRTVSYNAIGMNEPPWRSSLPVMSDKRLARMDLRWRERLQSSETVADAYESVTASLRAAGKLESTLIVVGSDNGYHAVTRRLPTGKRTPYLEDTVVPYVFIGPGIAAGATVSKMTSTIDLAPTFTNLLGTAAPQWVDGRSLVPFLAHAGVTDWRTGILSESLSQPEPGDPDFETLKPPKFSSLRTEQWLYVEYADGSKELFNRQTDPAEMNNILPTADPALVAQLHTQLLALGTCAGADCRVADSLPN